MADAYMTTDEVADRFRCSPGTVRWWRYVGRGPASIKAGRRTLYPVEAVQEYEAALRAEAAEGRRAAT